VPKGRGRPGETQEARLARECGELRHENRRLRRQVSRLQRQVEREPPADDPDPPEQPAAARRCPKCGSQDLGAFRTPGGKTLLGCRSCRKWRREA